MDENDESQAEGAGGTADKVAAAGTEALAARG
eukprot:COSAG06_NODE_61088_length_269_cov_0.170588_1_plen_31_part_10